MAAAAGAAAAEAAAGERVNRKALPTSHVDVEAEVRVLKALQQAFAEKAVSAPVGAIVGEIGDKFDMGGAGGDALLLSVAGSRFAKEGDGDDDGAATERRAVVEAWMRQGWPKRVLYAMSCLGVRASEETRRVRDYLESKVQTAVLDYSKDVDQPGGIVNDAAAACMVYGRISDFDGDNDDDDDDDDDGERCWRLRNLAQQVDMPEGTAEEGTVNTPPKDARTRESTHDDEFVYFTYDRKHRRWMNRIVVVSTGACPKNPSSSHPCAADCGECAEMVWNGLGHLAGWGGDMDLCPDDDSSELCPDWDCTQLFTEMPAMRPRPGRALIRVDNSGISNNGDQCATLLNVPLPDAAEDDRDIAAVHVDVTTD